MRKSPMQIRVLREEFEKEPMLSGRRKSMLARRTRLSEKQIYKWFWEERNKGEEG